MKVHRSSGRWADALVVSTLVATSLLGCGASSSGATVDASVGTDGGGCAALGENDCAFKTLPEVATCSTGELSDEWRARALAEVNRIRDHAGLPEVTYDRDAELGLQACALANVAAGTTEHHLTPESLCFSVAADVACQHANLTTLRFGIAAAGPTVVHRALRSPERFIQSWITDETTDGDLGHRRWLLDPFLDSTAFGMAFTATTDGGVTNIRQMAALQVIGPQVGDATGMTTDFVATPVGHYPASWITPDWYLSFAVVYDHTSPVDNAVVDFATVTVTVLKDGAPAALATKDGKPDVRHASGGKGPAYGLPNHLAWRMAQPLETGHTYDVTITNVSLPTGPRDFHYTFDLVAEVP